MRCIICKTRPIVTGTTCSRECHEVFVKLCEDAFGVFKEVTDIETGISYKVPTRDIIEKGLNYNNLPKYPLWEKEKEIERSNAKKDI